MVRQFYTGDAVNSTGFTVLLRFPTSQQKWVYSCFLGALEEMLNPGNWATGGETTPDEAALIFEDIWDNHVMVDALVVGDFKYSANPTQDINWLACNGAVYAQSVYPQLYAVIGATYNTGGEGAGNFRVPDFRGRVSVAPNDGTGRLPTWANALGGTGGEADHTLVVSEMPSHAHSDLGHNHPTNQFLPTAAGLEVTLASVDTGLPIASTGAGFANIQSAGGSGAHNNVQPSLVSLVFILAYV